MRLTSLTVCSALAILATTTACEKASPTRPSDVGGASAAAESVTDARTGATIIAGRPASPANGATIAWNNQPITLSITNGVTTGSSPITYTFQVATDTNFSQVVQAHENVAAGSGSTSVQLSQLAGSTTYYWRVQANVATGSGPYSARQSFSVGPEIVLGKPAVISPVNGAQAVSPLSLAIANVSRSGPAGAITYLVEISSDPGFGNVLFSTAAPEQAGPVTTVSAAVSGLNAGSTYFWRTLARDEANGISSEMSDVASFVAQSFSFATATIWDNPPDLGTWPEGARITYLEFTGFSMRVDFDRRTGPNRWPDVIPPGWAGPLQYTLGMCRNVNGSWHCSAVVQFWPGRNLDDSAPASRFWREWWYDAQRWGPLASVRPREGETVGVFVAAGDVRGREFTRASCPRVCEVSNIVMVPFTEGYARYVF